MTEKEIEQYINENTFDHHPSANDFGIGQFNLEFIRTMIKIKDKHNLEFKFYKKVTGFDDMLFKVRNITAGDNYLFVFPNKINDLSEFWNDFRKEHNNV